MMVARRLGRSLILRILGGLLAVPPVIGILTFVVFWALANVNVLPYTVHNAVHSARALSITVGILAVFVTALVAFPSVLILAERAPLSLPKLLRLGAILGNAPLVLIIVVATVVNLLRGELSRGRDLYDPVGTFVRVVIGLACGTVGAAVFWFVSIRGTALEEPSEE